jgi:hypothetical protein
MWMLNKFYSFYECIWDCRIRLSSIQRDRFGRCNNRKRTSADYIYIYINVCVYIYIFEIEPGYFIRSGLNPYTTKFPPPPSTVRQYLTLMHFLSLLPLLRLFYPWSFDFHCPLNRWGFFILLNYDSFTSRTYAVCKYHCLFFVSYLVLIIFLQTCSSKLTYSTMTTYKYHCTNLSRNCSFEHL